MDERPLHSQIADFIRSEIIAGKLKPGDKLPSVRELAEQRNCTSGTVQRAYHGLAQQGLISSKPGIGTLVTSVPTPDPDDPLRRVALFHRAEAFLIEALNSGHSAIEIESAVREAFTRWQKAQNSKEPGGSRR
jgi:GntR family transcriptional regulator